MTNPTISVELNRDIEVEVGNQTININLASVTNVTANFVEQNIPFYFDGAGGDTYLKYNSTTEKLELWVGGTKQTQWGTETGGDPFA